MMAIHPREGFGRKAEFLAQFLAHGLPFSARLRSRLLRPRAHRINAEAAVIDGGEYCERLPRSSTAACRLSPPSRSIRVS